MYTTTSLNVLLLGSYSMFLGMDWLYLHMTKVDCYYKDIECVDDNREIRVLQGKKKATLVRIMKTMQTKHNHKKECVLFAMHIFSEIGKEVEDVDVLSRYIVLQQF